jgi:hypothetical protein
VRYTLKHLRRALPVIVVLAAVPGCRERALSLLSVDAGTTTPPPPPVEEPHEVHFTFTGPDEVTFDWRGGNPSLRVWTKNAPPIEVEAHHPTPLPFSSPGPWQEATAHGLVPGSEYQY